jgi:hypothetical protein
MWPGKEGKEAQSAFAYKTSATQILFLQHVIDIPEARWALRKIEVLENQTRLGPSIRYAHQKSVTEPVLVAVLKLWTRIVSGLATSTWT